MEQHEGISQAELEAAANLVSGGREVEALPSAEIVKLMTIGMYLSDRGLAEIEKRGELQWDDGSPVVPYASEHVVETVLTRAQV